MSSFTHEVVETSGSCCEAVPTLDHFCGNGSLVRKTKSRCNDCGVGVQAEVWRSNDTPPRMYMRKYCASCGVTSSRISSDAQFYFLKQEGDACGCGPNGCAPSPLGENAKTESQLHTCTLVVEIVYDCNLACGTCYADSPHAKVRSKEYLPFEKFTAQIESVLAKQETIDIVQLSGGEPTLHPELFEIIAWLDKNSAVKSVLLNTNGVSLTNPLFVQKLAEVAPKGRFGVYLQYDGDGAEGQKELRGGDFRSVRQRALTLCLEYELAVALVMTVTHENKFDCKSLIDRALTEEGIRWVVFQPEFISGRNDKAKLLETPVNVADVIHSVARGGVMDLGSWMPLPCSDPNCGTVGFLVRMGGMWHPVSKFVDLRNFVPLIANRVNFDVDDTLAGCGCDEYNLGEYLERYGIAPTDIKMVFIKPFMDIRTWDEERIKSCCTHVLTPEGVVDSFCRYYGTR